MAQINIKTILLYFLAPLPWLSFLGVVGFIKYDSSKSVGGWDGGYASLGVYSLIICSILSTIIAVYLFQILYKSKRNNSIIGNKVKFIITIIPLSFGLWSIFLYLFMFDDARNIVVPLGIILAFPALYVIYGLSTILKTNKNA